MRNPTIADVAELAGVSKSTVSAVINNKSVVRETTRRAVLRAIEELSYRPSPSARRAFRPLSGKSITYVIKEARNPYYAEVLAGIQQVADERGYLVSVSSSEGRYDTERRIVEQCMEQEVSGLIITPILNADTDLSHIFDLKRNHIPFVLLEDVRGIRACLVDVDNARASFEAASYLIAHGHSRILHFAGPEYSEHSEERIAGIRHAFSASRLAFDEALVVHAGDGADDGYRAALAYFRTAAQRPTAVTCYNDLVAIGVLRALDELDIRVPDEVSVIGFDDLHLLAFLQRSLTTVRVPKRAMGRRAAELLIRQIESHREQPVEKIVLEAELVLRQSTRPLDTGRHASRAGD